MTPETPLLCCEKFKEEVAGHQIERDSDGKWCVVGCCGGCYVLLNDLAFCPFCGSNLSPESVEILPSGAFELSRRWTIEGLVVRALMRRLSMNTIVLTGEELRVSDHEGMTLWPCPDGVRIDLSPKG